MVSFRRGKKKEEMDERKANGKSRWEGAESDEGERVRVNDRRRINVEGLADEPAGGEGAGPSLKPSYVEELEARARAAEQKVLDVQARFEQVRAELRRETDEVRQRLARTADERAAREKAAFLASLLPVVDNLSRALEAAEAGGTPESLLDGLRGTISGFENALAQSGAEAIEAAGQTFDPELHEAVDTAEVEPEREGQVTAVYSRGYRIGNQLLRPARVQVGRAKSEKKGAGE
ncbi:MAG TPA: nucleotide exchange factor GrpE [Pyrinomonadaceae bacterium]|nr:nucleotide exchange factor GrpE [Pyrinomonadaceae bacterium]